jgi:hypothetical protein
MNIIRFSLLAVLAHVLQCHGQPDCISQLLSKLTAYSPPVASAQLKADIGQCQEGMSNTTPLGPNLKTCVVNCSGHPGVNGAPCYQECLDKELSRSPACQSIIPDITSIVTALNFPQDKAQSAISAGQSFLQCVLNSHA